MFGMSQLGDKTGVGGISLFRGDQGINGLPSVSLGMGATL